MKDLKTTLLIIAFWFIPILSMLYVMFNGYPNEQISIAIGLCSIPLALMLMRYGLSLER